jgi:hypothetical protein
MWLHHKMSFTFETNLLGLSLDLDPELDPDPDSSKRLDQALRMNDAPDPVPSI